MRSCRIESPALQATESKGALARTEESEERIIEAIIRMHEHALRRKGITRSVQLLRSEREQLRRHIRRCAAYTK